MRKGVLVIALVVLFLNTAESACAVLKPPEIVSEAGVLINADNGQIIYQKNINEKMYPASITKIMTGMLALKNGNLKDIIKMSYDAVFSIGRDTSHIALDVDEEITVEQALYALAMESANDAANGLAENISGSMEKFTELMNSTAKELGAENTHFANPHGLNDENHYTTALDMAKLTMAAIKIGGFTDIFGAKKYQIPPTNKQKETRIFANRNKLINGTIQCDGIVMSKNGWTKEAQNTLVTVAKRGDTTLIAVVMKSAAADQKFNDTVTLFDYGFENYKNITLRDNDIFSFLPKSLNVNGETVANVNKSDYNIENIHILIPSDTDEKAITIAFSPLTMGTDNKARTTGEIMVNGERVEGIQEISLTAEITPVKATSAEEPQSKSYNGFLIMLVAIASVFTILLLLVIIRTVLVRNKRRRRKRLREAREKLRSGRKI